MEIVEQIQLKPTLELATLCHHAKNLYNEANFHFRQFFYNIGELVNYYDLQEILKTYPCYRALPAQTAQHTLKLLIQNWYSYFKALREYKIKSSKFLGCPRPPNYKPKNGESIAIFTNQNTRLKGGFIYFPKSTHLPPVKTRITYYQQMRVVPKGYGYVAEIVYEKQELDLKLSPGRVVGIDLGVDNLVTMVNNIGVHPIIIKGGVAKSANQFYNKVNACLQSAKDRQKCEFQTKRQLKLLKKRNNKVHNFFHAVSRVIVNYCIERDIGRIAIGYNAGWKQGMNLGRKNNQNFTQLPLAKLVQMNACKARLVGIEVVQVNESYTSKCSALDREEVCKHDKYCGKRVMRGLFRSAGGVAINADVNAAYNILRKAFPESLPRGYGIAGLALVPSSVAI